MIYLDYAAGTPVDQQVLDLFYETTKKYYANPNSSHQLGKLEKNMIDQSTSNILKNLNLLLEFQLDFIVFFVIWSLYSKV